MELEIDSKLAVDFGYCDKRRQSEIEYIEKLFNGRGESNKSIEKLAEQLTFTTAGLKSSGSRSQEAPNCKSYASRNSSRFDSNAVT
ncbi:unnamed protein product [Dovyalis caffra]|uniref:Uncharacterized protein n=1 Tax=Dovyalis caffra TaxID=77055 RepID=A0AAV1SR37_9ROSI|nr:unnamed protein product [Dovyalis caffra]